MLGGVDLSDFIEASASPASLLVVVMWYSRVLRLIFSCTVVGRSNIPYIIPFNLFCFNKSDSNDENEM